MVLEQAKRQSEQISGVPNVTYDLLVMFTNKLEGIAALEEYKMDARDAGDHEVEELFGQLEQRAREDVQRIKAFLIQRLR